MESNLDLLRPGPLALRLLGCLDVHDLGYADGACFHLEAPAELPSAPLYTRNNPESIPPIVCTIFTGHLSPAKQESAVHERV